MKWASLFSSRATSSPPSVVRSSRFSGTMQTACGLWRRAIFCISGVAAISKVQRHRQNLHQPVDIGVRDMAAVFAQVSGDAVSTRLFRDARGAQRIRIGPATRVAHGGHVVDIYAQTQMVVRHRSIPF